MTDVLKVWDTGHSQEWERPGEPGGFQRTTSFIERTGATRVVCLTWNFMGKAITCPYPATVLPDLSGVVLLDEWHFQGAPRDGPEPFLQHLRVLNADGSLRLRIYPPSVDEHSTSKDAWIEAPRNFSEWGIAFGAPARDGYRDMVAEYDWKTGELLRWTRAPWLRY